MNHRLLITLLAALSIAAGGCSRPHEISITSTVSETGFSSSDADREENADGVSGADVSGTAGVAGSGTGYTDYETVPSGTDDSDIKDGALTSESAPSEEEIAVYVCGAVNSPDVYQLPAGSRIRDAIYAAGGFSAQADESWLNQAEKLYDGEMIVIYTLDETARLEESGLKRGAQAGSSGDTGAQVSAGSSVSGQPASDGRINLNTASREELMTLPGIGESKADSIIRYREENGLFASPEDVMNISGIKENVYSKIKDLITV